MIFFSKETLAFYRPVIHGKGIPADAVEITEDLWKSLLRGITDGNQLAGDANGYPELLPPAPPAALSRADVEVQRLRAYADPLLGSDRFFSEASRMQIMGDGDWESVRNQGISRYNEIQAELPWPLEDPQ